MAENENDTGKNAGKPKGSLGDLVKVESMVQLAIALPVGSLLGLLLGTALDKHFHTQWMSIVGVILGATGGFIQIIRTAWAMMKRGGP